MNLCQCPHLFPGPTARTGLPEAGKAQPLTRLPTCHHPGGTSPAAHAAPPRTSRPTQAPSPLASGGCGKSGPAERGGIRALVPPPRPATVLRGHVLLRPQPQGLCKATSSPSSRPGGVRAPQCSCLGLPPGLCSSRSTARSSATAHVGPCPPRCGRRLLPAPPTAVQRCWDPPVPLGAAGLPEGGPCTPPALKHGHGGCARAACSRTQAPR